MVVSWWLCCLVGLSSDAPCVRCVFALRCVPCVRALRCVPCMIDLQQKRALTPSPVHASKSQSHLLMCYSEQTPSTTLLLHLLYHGQPDPCCSMSCKASSCISTHCLFITTAHNTILMKLLPSLHPLQWLSHLHQPHHHHSVLSWQYWLFTLVHNIQVIPRLLFETCWFEYQQHYPNPCLFWC